jgi:hypothetical protein
LRRIDANKTQENNVPNPNAPDVNEGSSRSRMKTVNATSRPPNCPEIEKLQALRAVLPEVPDWTLLVPVVKSESKPEGAEFRGERAKAGESLRTGDMSEAQEALAPAIRSVAASNSPRVEHIPATSTQESFGKTFIQVTFILAATIVAPAVSIACFFRRLRRHSRHFGPLFRIDYARCSSVSSRLSAQTFGLAHQQFLTAPLGGSFEDLEARSEDPQVGAEDTNAAPTWRESPEQLELGPTFERIVC